MTVKELIKKLRKYPPDMPVVCANYDGDCCYVGLPRVVELAEAGGFGTGLVEGWQARGAKTRQCLHL